MVRRNNGGGWVRRELHEEAFDLNRGDVFSPRVSSFLLNRYYVHLRTIYEIPGEI